MSEDKDFNLETHLGVVEWFDPKRGIGFVQWSISNVLQKDMFVHFSDIVIDGFKTLFKGQRISFQIGKNKNGDPKAINVQILRH